MIKNRELILLFLIIFVVSCSTLKRSRDLTEDYNNVVLSQKERTLEENIEFHVSFLRKYNLDDKENLESDIKLIKKIQWKYNDLIVKKLENIERIKNPMERLTKLNAFIIKYPSFKEKTIRKETLREVGEEKYVPVLKILNIFLGYDVRGLTIGNKRELIDKYIGKENYFQFSGTPLEDEDKKVFLSYGQIHFKFMESEQSKLLNLTDKNLLRAKCLFEHTGPKKDLFQATGTFRAVFKNCKIIEVIEKKHHFLK